MYMKKETVLSRNSVLSVLGTIYCLVMTLLIMKYYFSFEVSPLGVLTIFIIVSLTSYPFFRNEPLFWRKKVPVGVTMWILHNLIIGVILFFLVTVITKLFLTT
jgi:hypothetical protein